LRRDQLRSPDDEGSRPAGNSRFLLDERQESFLVRSRRRRQRDERGGDGSRSSCSRTAAVDVTVASFSFSEFLGLGQGVQFGNNSANRIDLGGVGPFNAFEIRMGGSGGSTTSRRTARSARARERALLTLGLAAIAFAQRR
jgi:hypothetical protein